MNFIEHVPSWEGSISLYGSDVSALYVAQKVNSSPQPSGYRGLFLQVWSGWIVKVDTDVHLVQRLRIREDDLHVHIRLIQWC
jgi:hypothetical protein